MRTNLVPTGEHGNVYWRVVEPFEVYQLVGHSDSNTFYGSAMICGHVYRRVLLRAGDEVHALVGGTFIVRVPESTHGVPARMVLDEKSPFEKRYVPLEDTWPLARLARIDAAARTLLPYCADVPKMPKGRLYERSVDSILDPEPGPALTTPIGAVAEAMSRMYSIRVTVEYPGYLGIAESQINDDTDGSENTWCVGPSQDGESDAWTGQLQSPDGLTNDKGFIVYPEADTPEAIASAVYTHGIGDQYTGGGCSDCPVRRRRC